MILSFMEIKNENFSGLCVYPTSIFIIWVTLYKIARTNNVPIDNIVKVAIYRSFNFLIFFAIILAIIGNEAISKISNSAPT